MSEYITRHQPPLEGDGDYVEEPRVLGAHYPDHKTESLLKAVIELEEAKGT